MKIDLYTKAVLTVIAICLVINVFKDIDFIPSAYANEKKSKAISDENFVTPSNYSVMDVRIVDINTSKEMNVNLKRVDAYDPIKVNLKKIETSDKMKVNIEELGGRWIPYDGLPVKIKE